MMKRRISLFVCAILAVQTVFAFPRVVCDFENYAIGEQVNLWNFYGGTSSVKGTIVADPTNAKNKVLHLVVKEWNTYAEFALPQDIKAANIGKEYTKIRFRMQRANADEGDYKHMAIFLVSTPTMWITTSTTFSWWDSTMISPPWKVDWWILLGQTHRATTTPIVHQRLFLLEPRSTCAPLATPTSPLHLRVKAH